MQELSHHSPYEAFVEKDWYVVQVLAILSQYSHPKFLLCFSGDIAEAR